MNPQVELALRTLGLHGRDRITGISGVVTSVCFDLYGCIQLALHPGLDEKGEPRDVRWYDLVRIEIDYGTAPCVVLPDFVSPRTARVPGPAEKPAPRGS